MGCIKAIETEYNGYRFRSRLEARWAVFFDEAGIRYEYEPEGFEVRWEDGEVVRYLPDFYLTDFKVYCEVKPNDELLFRESDKIGVCIDYRNTPISDGLILLGPVPYSEDPNMFVAHDMLYWSEGVCLKRVRFKMRRRGYPTELLDVEDTGHVSTQSIPKEASVDGWLYDETCFAHYMSCKDFGLEWMAYRKARQARFEYGETPRPTLNHKPSTNPKESR